MLCGVSVVLTSLGDVLGLMSCKCSSENGQMLVGFQSTEAFGCLHHTGGGKRRPPTGQLDDFSIPGKLRATRPLGSGLIQARYGLKSITMPLTRLRNCSIVSSSDLPSMTPGSWIATSNLNGGLSFTSSSLVSAS